MKGERKALQENESLILETKVAEAIENLRSNTRAKHPTTYEELLVKFRSNGYKPIVLSELGTSLFGEKEGAELAVQDKVSRLKPKLSKVGLQIVRKTVYSIENTE